MRPDPGRPNVFAGPHVDRLKLANADAEFVARAIAEWTVERQYWMFSSPAAKLYASDATIDYLKKLKEPTVPIAPMSMAPAPERIASGPKSVKPTRPSSGNTVPSCSTTSARPHSG